MINKAINTLVLATVDSLTKFKNKLAYYLAIFAMVFGSTFGTLNSAYAADLTMTAADAWADGDGGVLATPAANDNVDVDGFILTINSDADIGAITDTDTVARNDAGDVIITSAVADTDLTITIGSLHNEGLVDIKTLDADNSTIAVTFEGAFDTNQTLNIESTEDNTADTLTVTFQDDITTGGAITIIADGDGGDPAVGSNVTVNAAGDITNGADSVMTDNGGGLATLVLNGTGAQTVAKEIAGAGAGQGTIQNSNTGGTLTFSEELGKTNELLALTHDASSTTVHTLAVDAVTITSAGTETYSAGLLKATTINKTAGSATIDATDGGDTINNLAGNGPADLNMSESTTINFTIASGETTNIDAVIDGTDDGNGTLTFKNTDANAPGVFTVEDTIGAAKKISAITIGSSTLAGSVVTQAAVIIEDGVTIAGGDAAAEDSVLNVGASLTAGSITLTQATGDATLLISSNATITGTIDGSGSGDGSSIVDVDGGDGVFASNVGSSTGLDSFIVDTGDTATLQGDLTATDLNLTGTANVTFDAAADQTFTGAITVAADDDGAFVNANTDGELTVTGLVGTEADRLTSITLNNGAKTTFQSAISAETLTISGNASGEDVTIEAATNNIGEDGGAAGALSIAGGNSIELGTAIGSGDTVFNAVEVLGADGGVVITAAVTVKPSANFTSGTMTFIDSAANTLTADEQARVTVQDTALTDFSVTAGAQDVTITATAKSDSTTASELSVTTNNAKSLRQAIESANTGLSSDSAALTALNDSLVVINGRSATDDTDLAKQVAPQDDMISGSTFATKAMTGSLQGIMSNRMASLRSGDAFMTGMSAGNGMSANSGFIQAFGTEAEQKNKTVGSGTQFGYDASSAGLALGFDGITDNGSVVGLSFSMSNTDVDGKGTGNSKNDIDSYTVSVYADKTTDAGYIEGSLTVGLNENNSSRIVNTAGLDRTYKGDYDSEQVSLKIGGGMPNAVGTGFVTPYGSVTATKNNN